MKTLFTDRLILRGWQSSDRNDLFEYAKLNTVGPFAGWKPHESLEESLEILNKFIATDDTWALELKENGKVIGSVGMHDFQDTTGNRVKSLGYVLSTAYEGRGLMTEACKRAIRFIFEEADIALIKVTHFSGNLKSKRVIEKCGFNYLKEDDYKTAINEVKKSYYYEIRKEDYKFTEENK